MEIRRCRHIKVNGTQCGPPALRGQCYCYFHNTWRNLGTYGDPQPGLHDPYKGRFPVLEDANSVQAALMQVIRLMLAKEIKPKEAGLLLYALQIASSNLKNLRLEPLCKQEVVVDTLLVGHSPMEGYPVRQEDFEPEDEKEKEVVSEREKYLKRRQQKADAQWETEICEQERSLESKQQESVVASQRSEKVPEISAQAMESHVSQSRRGRWHPQFQESSQRSQHSSCQSVVGSQQIEEMVSIDTLTARSQVSQNSKDLANSGPNLQQPATDRDTAAPNLVVRCDSCLMKAW